MELLNNCPSCNSTSFNTCLTTLDYFLSREEFEIVECMDCKLKFTNPRPGFNDIVKYYDSPEYISHNTSLKGLLTRLYTLARNFMLKKKFSIVSAYTKGNSILDVGCGTGEFLNFCKSKGFSAYGIELNERPRESAKMNFNLDVREKITDFIQTGIKFDCISLWHVLEHIHDLKITIAEIKTLLKPGGVLIVALPNCNSWDALHYKQYWAAYDLPRHLYHFNESSFTRFAEINSLKIVKVLPQVLDSFYISLLSEKYLGKKNNLFKAFINGSISNFNAGKPGSGYSSLIYILYPEII